MLVIGHDLFPRPNAGRTATQVAIFGTEAAPGGGMTEAAGHFHLNLAEATNKPGASYASFDTHPKEGLKCSRPDPFRHLPRLLDGRVDALPPMKSRARGRRLIDDEWDLLAAVPADATDGERTALIRDRQRRSLEWFSGRRVAARDWSAPHPVSDAFS